MAKNEKVPLIENHLAIPDHPTAKFITSDHDGDAAGLSKDLDAWLVTFRHVQAKNPSRHSPEFFEPISAFACDGSRQRPSRTREPKPQEPGDLAPHHSPPGQCIVVLRCRRWTTSRRWPLRIRSRASRCQDPRQASPSRW